MTFMPLGSGWANYRYPLSAGSELGISSKIFRMIQKKKIQISSNLAWLVAQMLGTAFDQCDPGEDRVIVSPCCWTTRMPSIPIYRMQMATFYHDRWVCANLVKSMKTPRTILSCVPCVPSTVQMWLWWLMPKKGPSKDKRIAGFAHEAGKGMIIVVNKWGYIEKDQPCPWSSGKMTFADQFNTFLCADCFCSPAQPNNAAISWPEMIKQISERVKIHGFLSCLERCDYGCHCH